MSDIGETFKAYREERHNKKAQNIVSSLAWLHRESISYVVLNMGNHHCLVNDTIDFWPSTGKWKERGSAVYKRGVRRLIDAVRGRKAYLQGITDAKEVLQTDDYKEGDGTFDT